MSVRFPGGEIASLTVNPRLRRRPQPTPLPHKSCSIPLPRAAPSPKRGLPPRNHPIAAGTSRCVQVSIFVSITRLSFRLETPRQRPRKFSRPARSQEARGNNEKTFGNRDQHRDPDFWPGGLHRRFWQQCPAALYESSCHDGCRCESFRFGAEEDNASLRFGAGACKLSQGAC